MDEIVLNFHITEKCNYSCRYCFAKYGLESYFDDELHHDVLLVGKLLREVYEFFAIKYKAKDIRLNLAGGEPLIIPTVEKVIDIAKSIGYKVSLITNSSPLTKKFIDGNAAKLSIVGLSIDSFSHERNIDIGRSTASGKTAEESDIVEKIKHLRLLNPDIIIKVNTVVSQYNFKDNMKAEMDRIKPQKWKIFKELKLGGSSIDDDKFIGFVTKNTDSVGFPVFVENNDDMINSYLMIDPLGRFYQNSNKKDSYFYSDSIIDVGVEQALNQITFDLKGFKDRYIAIK